MSFCEREVKPSKAKAEAAANRGREAKQNAPAESAKKRGMEPDCCLWQKKGG